MHHLALLPIPVVALGLILNGQSRETTFVAGVIYLALSLITIIALFVVYIYQVRFLKISFPRRIHHQTAFIAAAFILPAVAVMLGDWHALGEFGSSASNYSFVVTGLVIAVILGLFAVFLCSLGNMIFILTKGTSREVLVLGFVVRAIAWLFVLVATYFGYGIAYSVRDPSTE